MITLSMRDVQHGFRLPDESWLPILHDINVTIEPQSFVSIVGPSGSGKSTLLNLLGLLDTPADGTYDIDGTPASSLSSRAMAKLRGRTFGFVFQQFNLLQGRTATDNVAAPLLYSTGKQFWRRKQLAREMLDAVGLSERLDATSDRLSGGEQQRVAIARALVRRPQVILADEPTGALDIDTGRTVMGLLEELVREQGSTLVVITHDPAIAARAPHRYRMNRGHLQNLTADAVDLTDSPVGRTRTQVLPRTEEPS